MMPNQLVKISLCLFLMWREIPAAPLNDALDTQLKIQDEAVATQQEVDQLNDETRGLVAEYRQVLEETAGLNKYLDQLVRITDHQQQKLVALQQQLQQVAITRREMMPLLQEMTDTLARFVQLDTPFLATERSQRVTHLYALLDDPAVSLAERYRSILDAYQVEIEYSRTLEVYEGSLVSEDSLAPVNSQSTGRMVRFLRFGRVALYYLTLDEQQGGYWDNRQRVWLPLPIAQRQPLQQAMKMNQRQIPPDLLELLLPTPLAEEGQS